MTEVIGIRFKNCGRVYYFDANGIAARIGDRVILESEFGLCIGNVANPNHQSDTTQDLKKVLRIADADDMKQKKENEEFEREARAFCSERINSRGIPMKLVCSEVTLDRKRIVFYFTADGRIDFRELVKDLAAKFKTRIEMRQIGVRDKAKLVGGLGVCGRELCCRQFLTTFEPISIKMAKQQDLTLNTGKLSGVCGRLMCCLGYEYSADQQGQRSSRRKEAPPRDETPDTQETVEVPETTEEVACSGPEEASEPSEAEMPQKQEEGKKEADGKGRKKRRRRFRKRPPKNE